MSNLSIGEVAARTGKAPSAIRYYESLGLLPAPERRSGRRRYPPEAVRTLAVIDTAQHAGLTLDEIRLLLEQPEGERLREIAERKLPELDALIERAQNTRRWLAAAAECRCPDLDDCCLFD
jgi:MerR family transcriptional regulator, redox-sensitive transcriptional activator SoxR